MMGREPGEVAVLVNGPDFEVRWNVREVTGFDEVDFVRSIFMLKEIQFHISRY